MSLILLVEQEGPLAEQARKALAAEGWRVEVVGSATEARRFTAENPAELVVVGRVAGGRELAEELSSQRGGPGTLALVPEGAQVPPGTDGSLEQPFTDQQLRASARGCLTKLKSLAARTAAAEAASVGAQLTSHELFGDVLAEVEREVAGRGSKPAPPPPSRPPGRLDEVNRKLEQTLSGLLEKPGASAVSPRSGATRRGASDADTGVDDLLNQTLSGLGMVQKRPRAEALPRPPDSVAPAPLGVGDGAPRAGQEEGPAPEQVGEVPVQAPEPVPPASEAKPVEAEPVEAEPVEAEPVDAEPPTAEPPTAEPLEAEPEVRGKVADAASPENGQPPSPQDDGIPVPTSGLPAPPSPGAAPAEEFSTQRMQIVTQEPAEGHRELGPYTLLERVAVGGMAEVWKARMRGVEGFQKTVAIKRILPQLTDSVEFVTMFIDEAKLAAQLNHPHIIHIYDLGKLEDDFYIAMEYVEGKDLRSILNTARKRHQPLPRGLALLAASRLASALDHAHRKRGFDDRELGLVHRDVSPQNVLISYEGDIKLCDFGIVKAAAKASKTQMGALKGKLQYMSPEQAWGRAVDSRSDIFSLGAVLFEMLTGERLFAGDSEMTVLEAVRDARIRSPREIDPSIPRELEAIVLKALARAPDERYQSAGAMQKELEATLHALTPTPSQADLARYMGQLFAEAGKRAGAKADEGEAPRPRDRPAAESEVAAPAPDGSTGDGGQVEAVAPRPGFEGTVDERRGPWLLWVAALLFLGVLLSGAFVAFRALGDRGAQRPAPAIAAVDTSDSLPQSPLEPLQQPVPDEETSTGGPEAAAVEDQGLDLESLVDSELQAREEELLRQFEEERLRLERELEQVVESASAAPPREEEAPAAPQEEVPEPTPPAEVAVAATPEPAAAVAETPGAPGEEAPGEAPASELPPAVPSVVAQTPPVSPAPTPEPPVPSAPTVREGDLVEPGTPGLVAPTRVSMDQPVYPPAARRLRVQGTVTISLLVDETGRVVDTRLDQGVPQNVGLNEEALRAGATARFRPATKDGVPVKTWVRLTFPFQL